MRPAFAPFMVMAMSANSRCKMDSDTEPPCKWARGVELRTDNSVANVPDVARAA
jgi:hypothetical protein